MPIYQQSAIVTPEKVNFRDVQTSIYRTPQNPKLDYYKPEKREIWVTVYVETLNIFSAANILRVLLDREIEAVRGHI